MSEKRLIDYNVSCSCQNGYDLEGNDCVLKKQACLKKCAANQLCAYSDDGDEICVCQVGYYGENCSTNFCEDKANYEIISAICGKFGCNSTDGIKKPKFVCNCDNRFYYTDNSTGLCKMKDVCTEENELICESYKATCMPTLNFTSKSLIPSCVCAQGYRKDTLSEMCEEMCEFYNYNELINKRCYTSLKLKEPKLTCKPGFVLSDNVCILSQIERKYEIDFDARINLGLDIYLNSYRMKNVRPDLTNLKCNELLDFEGCSRLVNRSYLNLERKSNNLIIDQSFIYSFSNLISVSFQSILGDDLFDLQLLNYEVLNDSSNQSRKAFLDSKSKNETNKTIPYFKILKIKIYLETNGFFKKIDENTFLGDCQTHLCPIYPYLHVIRGSFRSKNLFLNQTNYLSECFPGSTAIFEKESNSLYRCTCNKGYKELARIFMSSNELYFKAVCFDVDECLEDVHLCDLNSTYCVNKPGGYECKCIEPLSENKDDFSCYELSELDYCDSKTTELKALPNFECQCKNKSLIRMDDYECWDPCSNVTCKIGECLPHENSHVCAYQTGDLEKLDVQTSTSSTISTSLLIILILWTLLNLIVTSLLIFYKIGLFRRK